MFRLSVVNVPCCFLISENMHLFTNSFILFFLIQHRVSTYFVLGIELDFGDTKNVSPSVKELTVWFRRQERVFNCTVL